jgi:hypothetical protein
MGACVRVCCHTLLRVGVDRHLVGQVGLERSSALRAEPLREEAHLLRVAEWHELQPVKEAVKEGLVEPCWARRA